MATLAHPYPYPDAVAARSERLLDWVTTTDHKRIGILYLLTTAVFFVLGGIEALMIRVQLAVPGNTFLDPGAYNAVFTMHGTTMIFLVVMPLLLGFANYFVPLQIGAVDMAFPRINAMSYWLLLFGGLILYFGFVAGTPPDTGWFSYAPLTEKPYSLRPSTDYWALGLIATSVGTIATGINLLITIIKLRAPSMTPGRIPVFTWMCGVTGFLILAAIPALTAAQAMLLLDRYAGTHFFDVSAGGDPLLWQNLFWYFGHPEVYIMVLPAFGIMSEVVPVFSRKPIFGYSVVVGSGAAIAFLSATVWAHHMFTVGLGEVEDALFGFSSMTIAVPTGIKIFSWLATMWGGRIRLTTSMLCAMAFVVEFTIGGITGVMFATVPLDWHTHETYFLVAHFHYVLFGGSFFGILAGTYYWFPKMTGRLLDEKLGKWNFWLTVVGFNLTFFPMHILGLMGQPRRSFTYPDLPGWGAINFAETIGAFILGVAMLVLFWNIYASLRHGLVAGANPWDAWTLEWATTSPPPAYNFATGSIPQLRSARPLWDLKHPADPAPPRQASQVGLSTRLREEPDDFFGRTHPTTLGILAFIFSEATFFAALIVTFLEYRTRSPGGPGPSILDVPRTALFSLALFASSATVWMAGRRLRYGDDRGFLAWLVGTIALGLVFLYGQATEYVRLVDAGSVPSVNLFTSAFYTLTGFHGLHVTIGAVALTVVAALALGGAFRQGRNRAGFEVVSIYWHFVDAVWVAIFFIVYLWNLVP